MKHTTTALILALSGGLVSACYPTPRMAPIYPAGQSVSNYAIGETMRAERGAVMVDRTDGSQTLPGFVLVQPFGIIGTSHQVPEDGGLWPARFEYRGACPTGAYIVTNPYFYEERVGIIISNDGTIDCDAPVIQLIGGNRGRTWRLQEQLPLRAFDPAPYVAGFSQDALRWQLVYDGRSGNSINVDYRELRGGAFDDDAEPAYRERMKFDLGRSKTIKFRNTEIQVVSATDREIAYRVVKDESEATRMPRQTVTTEYREYRQYPDNRSYDNREYRDPRDQRYYPEDGSYDRGQSYRD